MTATTHWGISNTPLQCTKQTTTSSPPAGDPASTNALPAFLWTWLQTSLINQHQHVHRQAECARQAEPLHTSVSTPLMHCCSSSQHCRRVLWFSKRCLGFFKRQELRTAELLQRQTSSVTPPAREATHAPPSAPRLFLVTTLHYQVADTSKAQVSHFFCPWLSMPGEKQPCRSRWLGVRVLSSCRQEH